MRRKELTEEQRHKIAPLLPPQKPRRGRPARDHRIVVNAIPWVLRTTRAPWRDLPERYGPRQTAAASRFYRWREAGVWRRVLDGLQRQKTARGRQAFGVRRHRGPAPRQPRLRGADGEGEGEAPGRGQAAPEARALGRGQVLQQPPCPRPARRQEGPAAIPQGRREKRKRRFDHEIYKERNRVERLVARLKLFRRAATRYEKTAESHLAMLTLAAILLWLWICEQALG